MDERVLAGIRVRWLELEPGGLGAWAPLRPDDLLAALDEETFRRTDERMPYFATAWPAGEALARRVLEGGALGGRRALDLGCGLGLCGLAAARRGASVTFLDWEERALALVAASAQRLGLAPPALVAADWRRAPPVGPQDLVLGADLLYEARNTPAVVAFVAAHLAPGGEALLADPGRSAAADLPATAAAAGLVLRGPERVAYRVPVDLYRLWSPER